MDRDYYQTKINNLLSDNKTYKEVENSQTHNILPKNIDLISNHSGILTDKEKDYLTNCSMTESYIYGLPKIHKSMSIKEAIEKRNYVTILRPHDLKFRPIIGGTEAPPGRLSHLIDVVIKPIVPLTPSYVHDDLDLLNKLPRNAPDNRKLHNI